MPDPEDFYNKNAQTFFNETVQIDLSSLYEKFLPFIPTKGAILDAGCGSGRDTKHFLGLGFKVSAFDQSAELCKLASIHTGIEVKNQSFNEMNELDVYDGIWACASLLHVPRAELQSIFKKFHQALRSQGVVYSSFKYGELEGDRGGRYFIDLTLEKLSDLLVGTDLKVIDQWITQDLRPNRQNEKWLNVILKK